MSRGWGNDTLKLNPDCDLRSSSKDPFVLLTSSVPYALIQIHTVLNVHRLLSIFGAEL